MPQQHHLGRPAARDLPHQLGADGPAGPRHQHPPPLDQRIHLDRVGEHGLAAQQVLDLHRPQLIQPHLPAQQLVDPGDDARAHACLFADGHDLPDASPGRRGHGDNDLGHVKAARDVRDGMAVAQHRHAVDAHVVLAQVVVDEPDRVDAELGIALQLPDDHGARVARAHDQHGLDLPAAALGLGAFPAARARGQPHHVARHGHGRQAKEEEDERHGAGQRQREGEKREHQKADGAGRDVDDRDSAGQQQHLFDRGVAPVAGVDAGAPQHHRRGQHHQEAEHHARLQVRSQAQRIEAEGETQVSGKGEKHQVADQKVAVPEVLQEMESHA